MRLLLDECVPKRLRHELPGHETKTVQDMGWAGIKNGALLKLADGQFDALLTVDQGIEYQRNLAGLRISVVVMTAASNASTTSGHCYRSLNRSSHKSSQVRTRRWGASARLPGLIPT